MKRRATAQDQLMKDYLREHGIRPSYAHKAGLYALTREEAIAENFPYARKSVGGIVIPYFHPFSKEEHQTVKRIRYLPPEPVDDKGKEARYRQRKKRTEDEQTVECYFDPNVNWKRVAKDIRCAICFVEGEMKALAMNQRGIITIGLGGVDMFGGSDLTPWLQEALG